MYPTFDRTGLTLDEVKRAEDFLSSSYLYPVTRKESVKAAQDFDIYYNESDMCDADNDEEVVVNTDPDMPDYN